VDAAALALYQQAPRLAIDYLTAHSTQSADQVLTRWRKLWEHLLYKYLDGNVKNELGKVTHPGYSEAWRQMVAGATGEHLEMRKLEREKEEEASKKAKSEAERAALVEAIETLLRARQIAIDAETQAKVSAIVDVEQLRKTLVRAATIKSGRELVTDSP
jgi:hypothetical protein